MQYHVPMVILIRKGDTLCAKSASAASDVAAAIPMRPLRARIPGADSYHRGEQCTLWGGRDECGDNRRNEDAGDGTDRVVSLVVSGGGGGG